MTKQLGNGKPCIKIIGRIEAYNQVPETFRCPHHGNLRKKLRFLNARNCSLNGAGHFLLHNKSSLAKELKQ
jgi:hypothetical protein